MKFSEVHYLLDWH